MKRNKITNILVASLLTLIVTIIPIAAACAAPAPAPTPTPVPTPTPTPTPTPAPAPEKVIELKWATAYPLLHPMAYDVYDIWGKELDKRTNGRTKTTLYVGSSLAGQREKWDAVTAGITDIADAWPHYWPGLFPVSEMYFLPFIAPSAAIAAPALWEITTSNPEILNEWSSVHLLGQHTSAIMNLHTSSSAGMVKTLEDLEGKLLASGSKTALAWMTKLGASGQQLTPNESYIALEKGIVEGGIWPWAPLRSWKLTEFLPNHTVVDLSFLFSTITMNKEKWETLPQDIQSTITEISGFELSALAGYTLSNGSQVDVQYMKDQGDQFYILPPAEKSRWAALVAYTVDEWLADTEAMGVDGGRLWLNLHKTVAKYSENPYPESEWWGPDAVGRYGSPNRPGGWD